MQTQTHEDAGEEEGGVDIGNLLEETGGQNNSTTRLLSSLMVLLPGRIR
jgi:hypothetical protein